MMHSNQNHENFPIRGMKMSEVNEWHSRKRMKKWDVEEEPWSPVSILEDCDSFKSDQDVVNVARQELYDPEDRELGNYVALVSHDKKKQEMVDFCKENRSKLSRCALTSTAGTGSMVKLHTGLNMAHKLPSGPLGGDQALGALAVDGHIDAILFMKDPLSIQAHYADIEALCRLSNVYSVPLATNTTTAKAVLNYIEDMYKGKLMTPHERRMKSSIACRKPHMHRCPSLLSETNMKKHGACMSMLEGRRFQAMIDSLCDKFGFDAVIERKACVNIFRSMKYATFKAGDSLIAANEGATSCAFLLEGSAQILNSEGQVLREVHAPEVLGESAVIDGNIVCLSNVVGAAQGSLAVLTLELLQTLKINMLPEISKFMKPITRIARQRRQQNSSDAKCIVVLSDENKENELLELLGEFGSFLHNSQRQLVTSGDFCMRVYERCNLCVKRTVVRTNLGGIQQIGNMICKGKVDAVINLKDPMHESFTKDEEALGRLADLYKVAYATNVATGRAILLQLEREEKTAL